MRLTVKAMQVLMVVDNKTARNSNGDLEYFYVPRYEPEHVNMNKYDMSGHLPDGLTTVSIHGSGIAKIFKSLELSGLIEKPNTSMSGNYAITEKGRMIIEEYRSKNLN